MNATKKKPIVDPAKQPSNIERIRRKALEDAGYPKDVLRVDVNPISRTQARVNVWIKEGTFGVCGRIAYSSIYKLT